MVKDLIREGDDVGSGNLKAIPDETWFSLLNGEKNFWGRYG